MCTGSGRRWRASPCGASWSGPHRLNCSGCGRRCTTSKQAGGAGPDPGRDRNEPLLQANNALYELLIEGAANPPLGQILTVLHRKVRLMPAASLSVEGRREQAVGELRALVEAIEAGDAEAAARSCTVHVKNAAASGIGRLAAHDTSSPQGEGAPMTTHTLTAEQQNLKDEFVEICGTWDDAWEALLVLDATFLRAYLDMAAVPVRKGPLEPKVRAFVLLTVSAAATHLYGPGIRSHIRSALDAGSTREEVTEVLELTSTLGIHAANVGVPLLVEVLEEEGLRNGPAPLDARQERLKADFTENRGYWHPTWNEMLELDPDLFETYTAFSSVPWKTGVLEPKVRSSSTRRSTRRRPTCTPRDSSCTCATRSAWGRPPRS
jgi:alkylhydroperoxidase/carboxymuconolactone decarboxylase family protein YurZ